MKWHRGGADCPQRRWPSSALCCCAALLAALLLAPHLLQKQQQQQQQQWQQTTAPQLSAADALMCDQRPEWWPLQCGLSRESAAQRQPRADPPQSSSSSNSRIDSADDGGGRYIIRFNDYSVMHVLRERLVQVRGLAAQRASLGIHVARSG